MADRIIALVDGSAYSASVCEHAGWIASLTQAEVEVMHVLGRREGGGTGDLSGALRLGARSAILEDMTRLDSQRAHLAKERGRAVLDDARDLIATMTPTPVSTRLLQGDLIDTVSAAQSDARVIVIGKRGEAADFARNHLGSNLERIARSARCPVLVASRSFRPIRSVLVAFDGGASAKRAVAHIAKSPVYEKLPLTLVTVGDVGASLQHQIEDAELTLRAAGRKVVTRTLQGQPETALAGLIADEGFDLLVMGAYGHSRIRSMMIGSTTTEMIRSCKVPVVLFR